MHTLHKLLFAKLCTCYCVWFWFGQPSLKILWFLWKCVWSLRISGELFENLNFGKTEFKTSVFKKYFISYSSIIFIKYYALRSFCIKLLCFFKKLFFPEFQSIEPVSRPIKLAIKILVWLCVFQSFLDCFWINRRYFQSIESNFQAIKNRIESFLNLYFSHVLHYSNFFQNSFSFYLINLSVKARFLLFSSKFFRGFLSSKVGKMFLPLLFHLFSCFMHFRENVEPKGNWDFWWFKLFLWKLINGFLLWDNIKLFLVN